MKALTFILTLTTLISCGSDNKDEGNGPGGLLTGNQAQVHEFTCQNGQPISNQEVYNLLYQNVNAHSYVAPGMKKRITKETVRHVNTSFGIIQCNIQEEAIMTVQSIRREGPYSSFQVYYSEQRREVSKTNVRECHMSTRNFSPVVRSDYFDPTEINSILNISHTGTTYKLAKQGSKTVLCANYERARHSKRISATIELGGPLWNANSYRKTIYLDRFDPQGNTKIDIQKSERL